MRSCTEIFLEEKKSAKLVAFLDRPRCCKFHNLKVHYMSVKWIVEIFITHLWNFRCQILSPNNEGHLCGMYFSNVSNVFQKMVPLMYAYVWHKPKLSMITYCRKTMTL